MFGITYDLINAPYYLTSDSTQLSMLTTHRTTHYTFLFNTFMMMNIFNQFNCRKLGLKEYNIFSRFFNNLPFIIIVAGEFVATWAMVTFGGVIFRTTPLSFIMFFTSLCFGAGSLLVGILLKTTPEAWVDKIKIELDEEGT